MKTSQLKAGVAISYLSMFTGYAISIAYTPVMLRLLGQSEYGLYNLVSSVVSYLGLFSFGFGSAYVRYYSRFKVDNDRESIARLNGMFLLVFSGIALLAVVVGSVLVANIYVLLGHKLTLHELSTAKILMGMMVVNMGLVFVTTVFNSHITANEQYVFQKILSLVQTVIGPFVILPILLAGFHSIGMVAASTVISISAQVANVIFCFKRLKIEFKFRGFDASLLKEITVFSFYIFLNMIIDQINWNVDKFILGRYRGTISVAVFGLASQLNSYYMSLSITVSSVFVPRVNRMVKETNNNQQLTELLARVGRIQFMVCSLILLGLTFFGKVFIVKWAGSNYAGSYVITLLLIAPVTIPLIQNLGLEIQRAKNLHKFRSWIYLLIAVLNISISIPLAKLYGGVGSALGTSIALLIGPGIIMNWYYHKRIGLDMRYYWGQIGKLLPSLLPSIFLGVITYLYVDLHNLFVFITSGCIYVVLFGVSIWFLGMNQYEKGLLKTPFMRILKFLQLRLKVAS